jgi:hypothetical protein
MYGIINHKVKREKFKGGYIMQNLEELIKECNYNPQKIGIKILEMSGYKVETFKYSDSIFVYDKEDKGKLLYCYND